MSDENNLTSGETAADDETQHELLAEIAEDFASRYRRGEIPGMGIEPGTYAWGSKRLFVDVMGEYQVTKHAALFANLRNIRDTPEDFPREGPNTPAVAEFRQRDRYGALWIFGVKGTF